MSGIDTGPPTGSAKTTENRLCACTEIEANTQWKRQREYSSPMRVKGKPAWPVHTEGIMKEGRQWTSDSLEFDDPLALKGRKNKSIGGTARSGNGRKPHTSTDEKEGCNATLARSRTWRSVT